MMAVKIVFSLVFVCLSANGALAPQSSARPARKIESAAETARELARIVDFLEKGQAHYRRYGEGTHSVEENKKFLVFLEQYEKELAAGRKKMEILSGWFAAKSALDTAGQ